MENKIIVYGFAVFHIGDMMKSVSIFKVGESQADVEFGIKKKILAKFPSAHSIVVNSWQLTEDELDFIKNYLTN